MPLPELVPFIHGDRANVCGFAERWGLDEVLAARLMLFAADLPGRVKITSGHRTREQQQDLVDRGATATGADSSTHTSCPATGADVVPVLSTWEWSSEATIWRLIAEAAARHQLRWGGTFKVPDLVHFDLGPRV